MIDFNCSNIYVLLVLIALYLFLPLTALTYFFFRKHRREAEVKRIFKILKMDESYEKFYDDYKLGLCLFFAVFYASVISVIGLALLFMGSNIGFTEFPTMNFGKVVRS